MAGEQLRYLDEILAGFPDNTAGLIKPIDVRDAVLSMAIPFGAASSLAGGTITQTTWGDINGGLNLAFLGGQGVNMDGSDRLYVDRTLATVPAGWTMLGQMHVQFDFESSNNTTASFRFAVNGSPVAESTIIIEWNNQSVARPVTLFAFSGFDVSQSEYFTLQMEKPSGQAIITNVQVGLSLYPLAEAPAAAGVFFDGTDRGGPL